MARSGKARALDFCFSFNFRVASTTSLLSMMLYRSKIDRVLCPLTFIATLSGTPSLRRLRTPDLRKSWNSRPEATRHWLRTEEQVKERKWDCSRRLLPKGGMGEQSIAPRGATKFTGPFFRKNSFSGPASRRVYECAIDQFIAWYCSEPRLAFNRIVVVCYRLS